MKTQPRNKNRVGSFTRHRALCFADDTLENRGYNDFRYAAAVYTEAEVAVQVLVLITIEAVRILVRSCLP